MNAGQNPTTRQDYVGQRVWIIGASSGIGYALAGELVARGARVIVSSRSAAALTSLVEVLGPDHCALTCDVTEPTSLRAVATAAFARFGGIDRVIFLAAVYAPMPLHALDLDAARQMVEVNLLGALHTVAVCLPLFKADLAKRIDVLRKPQLALCASVAGYTGLPGGQPYSATKAALINLAESLRAEQGDCLDVRVINPGFVRTRLTDQNTFEMPMIMTPQAAARAIADGLQERAFEIHFPKRFTVGLKLLRLLPYRWLFAVTSRLR